MVDPLRAYSHQSDAVNTSASITIATGRSRSPSQLLRHETPATTIVSAGTYSGRPGDERFRHLDVRRHGFTRRVRPTIPPVVSTQGGSRVAGRALIEKIAGISLEKSW